MAKTDLKSKMKVHTSACKQWDRKVILCHRLGEICDFRRRDRCIIFGDNYHVVGLVKTVSPKQCLGELLAMDEANRIEKKSPKRHVRK